MGAGQSKTQQLEAQITRLHDSLGARYSKLRQIRITKRTVSFCAKLFIAIFVPFLVVHLYLNRNEPILATLKNLWHHELLWASLAMFLWSLCMFFLDWQTERNLETIENERFKITVLVKEYESHTKITEVRSALKEAGQSDIALPIFSISAEDFGAQTAVAPRNSIFQRLTEWIGQDGPDRCYALICPMCHMHNGLIDPAEIPKLQYKCPTCKNVVTATKLVQLKGARVGTVDLDNLTEKDMEGSVDSSDDDEPPPPMVG